VFRIAPLALLLASAGVAAARQDRPPQPKPQDLSEMTLEELMKLEVTSVSKHEERLMGAPAAVSVLRAEDLRRMGVTSIPEALRAVPGVQVAHVDANKWAVSARGFNDQFANKLLVLMDGRSVYTPLFSGVHWAEQDTLLFDIDRIEVIRGPGATLWGANAVNGVINVITKSARETQGGAVELAGGSEERLLTSARWGGKLGEDAFYRVYAKYTVRDDAHHGEDDWSMGRAGFRADWSPSASQTLSVHGEYLEGAQGTLLLNQSLTAPPWLDRDRWKVEGGHVLVRWQHDLGADHRLVAKAYLDQSHHEFGSFTEDRRIGDLDLQHRFRLGDAQVVTWGAGYRGIIDEVENTFAISLDPHQRTDALVSTFVQDEIRLAEELTLALGSKFEYNTYTGVEYQPGARLAWAPHARHTLWASAARAVRTPSRVEDDGIVSVGVLPGPTVVQILGTRDYQSEELLAYELGYRVLPHQSLSLDLALFYHEYDDLRTAESAGVLPGPPVTFVRSELDNKMGGTAYGAELSALWQVADGLRVTGAFTLLRVHLDLDSDSTAQGVDSTEDSAPRGQVYLRASWDPLKEVRTDVAARYVGRVSGRDIDSYVEMDARIAWDLRPNLELALVGQNLLHDEHLEAVETTFGIQSSEMERGVYLSLSWRF
jgi:iron complex outermembrane receptor protein